MSLPGTPLATRIAGMPTTPALELSQVSYRRMTQNPGWEVGYNPISASLAAGILTPVGFVLPMSVGAILMSLPTVVMALNARPLRRLILKPACSTTRILDRA